jgi:O-antigen/teichoic acid export membrane protein
VKDSKASYVAKNVSTGVVTQVISLLVSFVSRTIFIIALGNEYLSVNGLFTNVLTILSFTELGIGSAIIYSLYKPIVDNNHSKIGEYINLYATAYRWIACIILGLGICVIPFLDKIINNVPNIHENITVLYVLFLLNTVCSYICGYKKSLLIAYQKNYIVISITTVMHVVQLGLQAIALFVWHDYMLYLYIMIGVTLTINIITTAYVNKIYPWIKQYQKNVLPKVERNQVFLNIKNIVIYKLGSVILGGSDNIIISGIIRTTLVGICSNYVMVISSVTAIVNQAISGISASIGQYNVSASTEDNKRVYDQLCLMSFYAFGSMTVVLSCALSPFIKLWLGESYLLSPVVSLSLALGFYSLTINSIPSSYRSAMGLFKEARLAPFYAAIVNITLSIIGAKIIGLVGVFVATYIARFTTFCVIDPYYVMTRGFRMKPYAYYVQFAIRLVIVLASWYISYTLIDYLHFDGIINLLVSLIISILIFSCLFLCFYARTELFAQVKGRVLNNILLKRK